ncbi:fructosamine kinase family protein [Pseudooceanicola sp. CBS1P-1]|uniref:Phosphotransferase n=1 Tax=Pseudooceanicola albus TaxID=2692189 RepID=A0A6L7G8G3_9RHOB|nr:MULTISPECIES: fructosamine kinase family protein [Pseudooceanicola]MBT9385617.1 fructosamine kinase family protein [Pseudooceanicola endophyticus]MXN18973.1 phosphotransferase [Pseudooceanicola albus]
MTPQAVAKALGHGLRSTRALHGGDLSEVLLLELEGAAPVVLKRGPLVAVEGRMLQALAQRGAATPEVLLIAEGALAMRYLGPAGHGSAADWQRFGARLRALHDSPGHGYGWPEDYAFGPLHIPGSGPADWPGFWAEARLLQGLGTLPAPLARRLERLAARLPDLLPARPHPALLHGDLWQGNLHVAPGGRIHLIDPACCHGDPEVDLAMLGLFGRPPAAFLEGYGPLSPGWQARRPLYQLWPALVHLRLFGGGYAGLVADLLTRLDA